jgi:hypothetical protein
MRRFTPLLVLVLYLLSACDRRLEPAADTAEADKALRTALEAWKGGKSQGDLEKERPSIIMNEDDWRVGKRLLDFQLLAGSLSGRQVRWRVRITLQDKDNKPVEREATYIIDTTPRIVIVRDTFAI